MTGIDSMIRARLAEFDASMGSTGSLWGAEEMRAAIEAVLERHKPRSAGIPNKPHIADCCTCMDVGPEVCSPAGYPCETVEAIAGKLGIGVDGG